jgi:hypothetical protein
VKALCWEGVNKLSVEQVPDPVLRNDQDVIVRLIAGTTCGSDLHLIGGYIPFMRSGDVIGHEFIGEVVEVGSAVRRHKVGDRVVVCSFVGCGRCWYCTHDLWSLCATTPTPTPASARPCPVPGRRRPEACVVRTCAAASLLALGGIGVLALGLDAVLAVVVRAGHRVRRAPERSPGDPARTPNDTRSVGPVPRGTRRIPGLRVCGGTSCPEQGAVASRGVDVPPQVGTSVRDGDDDARHLVDR